MKRSGIGPVALILTLMWATAWALTQAGQSAHGQGQAVLRVATRLVVVNVAVHDKKGAPVAGLTRHDFTIFDGGGEEKIADFSVEPSRAVQGPLAPLPPNVFSNRVAREGAVPASATVILLDGQNTEFSDQVYARGELIKFLSQLRPHDRVALYVLGGRLQIIQDFTSDPAPLLEAIREQRGRVATAQGSSGLNQAPEPGLRGLSGPGAQAAARLNAGMYSLTRRVDPGQMRQLWDLTPAAIEAIANHLSGLPGRKSIIWVTGGVPLPQALDYFGVGNPGKGFNPLVAAAVRHMIQVVNQDDVALYPVDARGLFTDPGYNAENEEIGSGLDGLNFQMQGMIHLAQETGGRAFYNTNDLKGSIRTALDDSELTYTLGYYPSHGRWHGKYRPIKVRVKREGVDVRYRRGYFANAGPPPEKTDPVTRLKEAARSPLDATALGVTVRLRPTKREAGEQFEMAVYVDVHGLTFRPANGLTEVSFDVWAGQYSNQGDSLGGVSKTVTANLKEEDYQKIVRAGRVNLTLEEKAERGVKELRVVVRDASSGSVGSVRIPLRNST